MELNHGGQNDLGQGPIILDGGGDDVDDKSAITLGLSSEVLLSPSSTPQDLSFGSAMISGEIINSPEATLTTMQLMSPGVPSQPDSQSGYYHHQIHIATTDGHHQELMAISDENVSVKLENPFESHHQMSNGMEAHHQIILSSDQDLNNQSLNLNSQMNHSNLESSHQQSAMNLHASLAVNESAHDRSPTSLPVDVIITESIPSEIQLAEVSQPSISSSSTTLLTSEPHMSSSTSLVNNSQTMFDMQQQPSTSQALLEGEDDTGTRTRKSLRISQLRSSTSSTRRNGRKRTAVDFDGLANDSDFEQLLTEEDDEDALNNDEIVAVAAARSKTRKRFKPEDQDFVVDDVFEENDFDDEIDDEDFDEDYEEDYRPLKKRRITRRKVKKAGPAKRVAKKEAEIARLHRIIYQLHSHHTALRRYNQVLIDINMCLGDQLYRQFTGEQKRGVALSTLVDDFRNKGKPEIGPFVVELGDLVRQYDEARQDKTEVESKIDDEVEQRVIDKAIGRIVKNRRNFSLLEVVGDTARNGSIQVDNNQKRTVVLKRKVGRPPKLIKSTNNARGRKKKVTGENGAEEGEGEGRTNRYQRCQYPNCTYESKRVWALQEHINLTHTGLKQFGCKVDGCPATFFGSSELDNHMKKCHAEEASKEFMPCTWPGCNALFKSKLGLRAHIAVHKGENMIQCDWPGCNYQAKNKRQYENHTRKHTGDRPFDCDYPGCVSKFRTNDSLRHHKKSHSEYRPFRCDWPGCEATFKTNRGLTIHRALHTGEKLFKCDYPDCTYASERKYHVDLHIFEQHTHQKPFQCTWQGCDASFLRNDKLQNHLKIHRQEKPYKCAHPSCDKHFVEKGNMMKHYNNVHKR